MRQLTDSKVHYKMYKKGRMWLIAGVATLTLQVVSLTGHADTDNAQTDSTTQNTATAAALQSKAVTLTSTTSSENKTSNTDTTSQSAATATSSENTQTSVVSSQSQSTQTNTATSTTSTTSSVSASSATSSSVTDDTSQAADTVTSATSNNTSSAVITTTTDQAASASSNSTATSVATNAPTSAVSGNSQSGVTNETAAPKVAVDTNSQLKTSADETTTTVIKSSAKSQLARAAVTTTGYDDPSNLDKGISGTSKWYVTSTGELHIEKGTLGEIVALEPWGDLNELGVNVMTDEIPWYSYSDVITTIILDGPVIAGKSIAGVFSGLQNLTSIQNLNLLDTSNTENMDGLFYDDESLTSLDLSNFNTKNVTTMFMMFNHCYKLTSLDLSTFDTSNVTNMGSMFLLCSSLTSLNVSNFNTSQVTNMAAMFAGLMDPDTGLATHLYGLDLSNFDTSKVTNMMGMFLLSSNLTSLDLSSFDTSQVTNMGGMFGGTSSLTALDLSNFDMRQVASNYDDPDGAGFMTNQTALKTLKLGANTRLVVGGFDSELPDVPNNGFYMGKWISTTTGKTYTSAELMALYADTAQTFAEDTFVWQGVVIVQDTTLVAGPKTEWSASDNYSSESTQSFADVTVIVDGVLGGKVDTTKPGTYQVVYQYTIGGVTYTSEAATVTVVASQANITAENKTLTQNDTWDAKAAFTGGLDADGNAISSADVKVSGEIVDTSKTGTYNVTYSYTDDYGNEKSVTIMVTVVATTATVNAEDKTVTQGSTWNPESGFTAGVDEDGNALSFSDVKVSGETVDTKTPGTYKVIYTYTDKYGNEVSQTIKVTVAATSATVNAKDTTLTQGATWNAAAGFVGGTDAADNALSFTDVKVGGDIVDTKTPGVYKVIYTYTDKYGNEVSQTVKVTVVATSATVDAKNVTLTQGATWNAAAGFVGGTDVAGNALSFADVKVSGDTVDTKTPGTYKVTYTYTDKYGNEVSQTVEVTIVATNATVNAKDTTLNQGDIWNATDGFVGGTDAAGDELSFADIKVSGDTVDTKTPGTYKVIYTYTDEYGNEVSQTIEVTVTTKDTDNNGGGTDTGDNGDGDNNGGGADTDNNGNSDNNGGTTTDNSGDGETETTNDSDTITTGNTTSNSGSTVNADYQTGSTGIKTVKLNAMTKGTTADQVAKGSLPQTGETEKTTPALLGLALLGLTSMLTLAGIKRQRTDK